MYKITNISGYLAVAGLYPGETKLISDSDFTDNLKKCKKFGLIAVEKVTEQKKQMKNAASKEKLDIIEDEKKDEVNN